MTIDRGGGPASVGTNADTLDATKLVVTPVGGLAATTGQAAFQELDAELALLQPLDATLTALAGVTTAADKVPYFTGTDAATVAALTAYGRRLIALSDPSLHGAMGIPVNFSLSAAVASNALTMSVKGADGNAPSSTNPVYFPMRSSTATSGGFNWRSVTAALSLTISSGSTLGHNSALKQYIYWYAIDNAGTVELAAASKFFGTHGIVSTTAEGGAGAADSGTVMYSTTARSNVPFLCIGYSEDTQTTAGTWAAAPSQINLSPFTHPVISFSAHKNGADQSGVVTATFTKVTFPTEIYDNGGLFDAVTNYRWTPPPGRITLMACVPFTTAADQSEAISSIYKNGADYKRGSDVRASGASSVGTVVSMQDECNGTDYYEIFVLHTSGSDRVIDGRSASTHVMGSWSPQ